MMRLTVLLILLSGCVAPREAYRDLPDPQSLDDVNALLRDATVEVVRVDGAQIPKAREVTIAEDSVRFTLGRTGRRVALPTSAVALITAVRDRGTRAGAAVGAVPGVLAVLSSIASSQSVREGERAGGRSTLALGVPAVLAGAAFGAFIGQLAVPGETVALYRAPIQRYAPASRPPPPETSRRSADR